MPRPCRPESRRPLRCTGYRLHVRRALLLADDGVFWRIVDHCGLYVWRYVRYLRQSYDWLWRRSLRRTGWPWNGGLSLCEEYVRQRQLNVASELSVCRIAVWKNSMYRVGSVWSDECDLLSAAMMSDPSSN
jgi:hypothetical protein